MDREALTIARLNLARAIDGKFIDDDEALPSIIDALEAFKRALNEDATCGTCGEYAGDGYLCDQCRTSEENQSLCQYECKGKVHHTTVESAAEHVASLVDDDYLDSYAYECDSRCEWSDGDYFDRTGRHWHVASSPVPRRMREWVES
jgi:hypothetical protein